MRILNGNAAAIQFSPSEGVIVRLTLETLSIFDLVHIL